MQNSIKIPVVTLFSYILFTIVLWDTRGLFVSTTAFPIPTTILALLLLIQVYGFWCKKSILISKAIWVSLLLEFLLHIISLLDPERSLNHFAKVTKFNQEFTIIILSVFFVLFISFFRAENKFKTTFLFVVFILAIISNLLLIKTSIVPNIDTYTYVKTADQLLLQLKNPYLYKFDDLYSGEYNHIYGTSFCFNYLPLVVYITSLFEYLFSEIRFAYAFFNVLFCMLIIKNRAYLKLTLNLSILLSISWLMNPVQMFILERAFIDSLVPFFLFSAILLLYKNRNVLSAIVLGLLASLKLYYFFLLPFIGFYWFCFIGIKKTMQYSFTIMIIILLTILPFLIDNYQVFYFNVYAVYANIGTRVDSLSFVSYCAKKGIDIAIIGQKIGMSILALLSFVVYFKKMEIRKILSIINIAYLILFFLMRQAFANYFYFNLVILFTIILIENIEKNKNLCQVGTSENPPSM
jgi:hypothetical protein